MGVYYKKPMIETAIQCVKEAGDILHKYYHVPQVSYKKGLDGRKSTVTQADRESEAAITGMLIEHFPEHGIYGEEGTRINNESDYLWYIDPLDGTTNFSRSIPLFGISLGLTYKKVPVLGVLFFPELHLLVTAEHHKGAQANGEKIHVSSRPLPESLYFISTAETRDGWNFPSLKEKVGWVRAMDVSSFEFSHLAQGNSELYTFKKSPHDMVAGTIIIQEAGGMVTDEKGENWTTDANFIIASNGVIHKEVLSLIQSDLQKK